MQLRDWNAELAVYRLLALGMELPEETFVNSHGFDAKGETYGACTAAYVT